MRSTARAWGIVAVVVVAIVIVVLLTRGGGHKPVATINSASTSTSAGGPRSVPQSVTGGGAATLGAVVFADGGASSHPSFAFSPWGSGDGELGRKRPQEANPEAPMSLTSDGSGRIVILDQVNGRLVRLDKNGKPSDTIALSLRAPQDVAAAKDGSLAVLDRLGDKQIAIVGPDGKTRGTLPLEGKGITEGGAVTGVFVDGNDVYAEREHGQLVLIGDLSGKASSERTEIPGRPTRDGHAFVSVFLGEPLPTDFAFLTVNERPSRSLRYTRKISLPVHATGILLLDTDRAGVIYLALLSDREVALLCIEPKMGTLLGTSTLPPNTMPEETFRDFTVLDEGGVMYSSRDERGVTLLRADCRP